MREYIFYHAFLAGHGSVVSIQSNKRSGKQKDSEERAVGCALLVSPPPPIIILQNYTVLVHEMVSLVFGIATSSLGSNKLRLTALVLLLLSCLFPTHTYY